MHFCVAAAVGADSAVALGAFLLDRYVHVLVSLCCCSRTRLLATYQAQQVSLQMNLCVIIFYNRQLKRTTSPPCVLRVFRNVPCSRFRIVQHRHACLPDNIQ